ncbi:hypothetical protein C815_01601 [Firmicutes bacterium M10-2]|nr:hypothetical protein C815_01601 [Firmicutes bacterium M10-2]
MHKLIKNKALYYFTVLSILTFSMLDLFKSIIFGSFFNTLENERELNQLAKWIVAFVILMFIIEMIMKGLMVYFKYSLREKLSKDLYESWLNLSPDEFQKTDTSARINKQTNEINTIIDQYITSKLNIYRYGFLFIIGSFYIGMNSRILLLFIYVCAISLSLFNRTFKGRLESNQKNVLNQQKQWIGVLKGFCSNFLTIKDYDLDKTYSSRLQSQNKTLNKITIRNEWLKQGVLAINDLGVNIIFFGESLIGFYMINQGYISLSVFMAIIQASNMVINPIGWYMEMYNNVQSSSVVVNEYLKEVQKEKSPKEKLNEPISSFSIKDLIFKRKEKTIFDHFSLQIQKGKKYLIVGESGCGKSTLLELLSGTITHSDVFANDVPMNSIEHTSIAHQLTYLRQHPDLLPGTLEENITLWEPADAEKLNCVLDQVHLNSLKSRLCELVQEDSLEISGGELQRLSLARGLYNLKDWLFLDEAFSALDEENAKQIENDILKNYDISIVSISHKLFEENILLYDEVIEFTKNGVHFLSPSEYLQKRKCSTHTIKNQTSNNELVFPDKE